MPDRFYITTPSYYVNEQPHIGHLYSTTLVDVAARTHRMNGDDVFFLTGTDEHAAKVIDAARERGLTTREWADRNARAFQTTFAEFEIANDDFLRTSEPRHIEFVEWAIGQLVETGDVYLGVYEGWYDENQEEYVPDSRAREHDFKSPITGRDLVKRSEENYFFKLSAYEGALLELLAERPEFVLPDARRNEVVSRIREGLADIPISRGGAGDWGVKFPGAPDHLVYVWVDALLNYTSGINTEERRRYWPAAVHLIGKDILWFHAVIWPALLLALSRISGNEWLQLPGTVYAHSFWMREGKKMSKSLGNFVDLKELADFRDTFGLDALRYFLATQGPLEAVDSDFTRARFIDIYNSVLANTVGNCINRITNMTGRYLGGHVATPCDGPLRTRVEAITAESDDGLLGTRRLERGLAIVRAVDGFLQETEPFKLAKDPAQSKRVGEILYQSAEAYRIASLHLWPALPTRMETLWSRIGCSHYTEALANRGRGDFRAWCAWGGLAEGTELVAGDALFPRYTDD